jgi:pullulanase/glycogen debranching enzyme
MRHPHLTIDLLRYWILGMHADGFPFDLAVTLARGIHDVEDRTFAGMHEQTIPKDVDKSKYSSTDPVSCLRNQPDGADH